jgi:hypothetical protein
MHPPGYMKEWKGNILEADSPVPSNMIEEANMVVMRWLEFYWCLVVKIWLVKMVKEEFFGIVFCRRYLLHILTEISAVLSDVLQDFLRFQLFYLRFYLFFWDFSCFIWDFTWFSEVSSVLSEVLLGFLRFQLLSEGLYGFLRYQLSCLILCMV